MLFRTVIYQGAMIILRQSRRLYRWLAPQRGLDPHRREKTPQSPTSSPTATLSPREGRNGIRFTLP